MEGVGGERERMGRRVRGMGRGVRGTGRGRGGVSNQISFARGSDLVSFRNKPLPQIQ